jgi:hypothetical protein
MPRTVRVTAGDKVFVGGTITEVNEADISDDTIVVLLPLGTYPDESTTGQEPDSDTSPSTSSRLVKMLITDTTYPGSYQLWGRITDDPEREWLRLDTVTAI